MLPTEILALLLSGRRRDHKAEFIRNVVYRDLKAKEDARLAAAEAARLAARPEWKQRLDEGVSGFGRVLRIGFGACVLVLGVIAATLPGKGPLPQPVAASR